MITTPWQWPHFDPIFFSIGPLALRWYRLLYLVGFCFTLMQTKRQARQPNSGWQPTEVEALVQAGFIGLLFGGRIGYILVYQLDTFITDPLSLLRIWEGGMSFHGGLVGALIAFAWFARRTQRSFLAVADFIAPWVPVGLGLGRLGNWINGELWGRVTTLPWEVVFPQVGPLPRHPSQLYEAFLEGVVLFLLLRYYRRRTPSQGLLSALFLIGYGSLRFMVEYLREPDPQFIAIVSSFTMGQWLSIPMVITGVILWYRSYRKPA
jgi:phosphatidylglycerol:prolipoprotein diacylglycerol transferase